MWSILDRRNAVYSIYTHHVVHGKINYSIQWQTHGNVDYKDSWVIFLLLYAIDRVYLTVGSSGIIPYWVTWLIGKSFVLCVIALYRKTPFVKASEQGSMLLSLTEIAASCSMTFIILSEPSTVSCAVIKMSAAICYTFYCATIMTRVI